MPKSEEITEFQSFTERTLKFGRNLMAATVPIILFAWVDALDIKKFKPFDYEIQKGEEIFIWGMLLGVLLYYGVRFVGLAIPDILEWLRIHGAVNGDLSDKANTANGEEKEKDNELSSHRSNRDNPANRGYFGKFQRSAEIAEKELIFRQATARAARSEYNEYR